MQKYFCDLCGEEISKRPYTRYKIKKEWVLWEESGWEKMDVHDECFEKMCEYIRSERGKALSKEDK